MRFFESVLEDRGQLECLRRYECDLLRWGRALNLVSRVQPEVEVDRLLLECILVARWLENHRERLRGRWADIGSGAGFPGLVFGALSSSGSIDLIERRQGRCDFLRREIRALGLVGVQVLEGDAGRVARGPYALISMKAVAPPDQALSLAAPHLGAAGHVVLFQRPEWEPPSGWVSVDRWVGPAAPVDLRARAAHLLQRRS